MAMIYGKPVRLCVKDGHVDIEPVKFCFTDERVYTFNSSVDLYVAMVNMAATQGLPVKVYREPRGTVPVLSRTKYGKPYMSLVPPHKAPSPVVITTT